MMVLKKNFYEAFNSSLLILVTLLPFFLVTVFYVHYAFSAWFFQDDFGFIREYTNHLALHQLSDFSNFGRFVSRNLYWFVSTKLFGTAAYFYYLLNFFFITVCAYILYKIFERRQSPSAALIASLMYFCLPAVIYAYSWLSNSQHLIGHLLVLLFIFQYLALDSKKMSRKGAVFFLFLFLIGLLSNVFMGLVLSLPLWYMLTLKQVRKDKNHWFLVASGILLLLFFVVKLRQYQGEAYEMAINFATLKINVLFYFQTMTLFFSWLAICFVGSLITWHQKLFFESWLFLASVLFFMPFAWLVHQRYEQYAVLMNLFFLLALWSCVYKLIIEKRSYLLSGMNALVALGMLVFVMEPVRYFSVHAWGADQQKWVAQLSAYHSIHNEHYYCFDSLPVLKNDTGVKVWDVPASWWFVGFGQAFTLFVDVSKSYQLTSAGGPCDVIFLMDGSRLIQQMA